MSRNSKNEFLSYLMPGLRDSFISSSQMQVGLRGLCLNCGRENLRHAVKDVPYEYKGHATVVPKIAGWHCPRCHEVEFDSGEGERFADTLKRIATEIDARESAELARIRKKLKLTQLEAASITGGGPNAFSRYERGKARPLPAVTNLFRLLDRHPELLAELQK